MNVVLPDLLSPKISKRFIVSYTERSLNECYLTYSKSYKDY